MNYAAMIDHTLLKPEATSDQIQLLCEEAKKFGFASVCVNPSFVPQCAANLKGTKVKVCTVVGFPLGATSSSAKACETTEAVNQGAEEIDMVIAIGKVKEKNKDYVLNDIQSVVKAAQGRLVKVIFETCLLTPEEIVWACEIALKSGAHFVKTSTGFSSGGATLNDVELMKKTVGNKMEVKASGGIRTYEDMVKMVEAGASRIGTSSGPKLLTGQMGGTTY